MARSRLVVDAADAKQERDKACLKTRSRSVVDAADAKARLTVV